MTRDQWESMASATFVPVRISHVAPNFTGVMTHSRAGDVGLSRVRSASCRVLRSDAEIAASAEGFAAFAIQLRGTIEVAQDDRRTRTAAGEGVLYLTDHPYALGFPERADLLILQAPIADFGMTRAALRRLAARSVPALTDPDLSAGVRIASGHLRARDDESAAATLRVGLELVGRALHRRLGAAVPARSREAAVLSLTSRIAARLDDPALDVARLARAEGVSVRTVHSLFDTLGTTPARYIRSARIERARHLLHTTNLRVADVAVAAGFADGPTLSRVFRREVGMTPGEVRAQVRADAAPARAG